MAGSKYTHDRIPEGIGLRFGLLTLAIGLLLSLGLELALRSLGIEPAHYDTERLWGLVRLDALNEEDPVVIVGSSRTQIGIQPDILARELNRPVFQLSVNGGSPFPVLEHVAKDPRRPSMVIVEFTPRRFADPSERAIRKADRYVADFERRTTISILEQRIRTWARDRLAFLSPAANARSLLSTAIRLELPEPPNLIMHGNRWIEMRYSEVERERATRKAGRNIDGPVTDDAMAAIFEALQGTVKDLVRAGVEVRFVRPPTCSPLREVEERVFPRELVFDTFARDIHEASWIHDHDLGPAEWDCVDGSHLDPESALTYTRRLAAHLKAMSEE